MSNELYREMRAAYLALVDIGVLTKPRRPPGRWPKGTFWVSEEDSLRRKEARRQEKIERKRALRRAAGVLPRPSASIAKTKPWLLDGVSERTWYRRRKKEKTS